jgi:hypothetical protein
MIVFSREDDRIYYKGKSWECRHDFFQGVNSEGKIRASLPIGYYVAVAENPPAENSYAYGTFYISTGDYRGRDIHGGGSDLDDPFAEYQGWEPTLGCLRMQNADGKELSYMMIDDGNSISLKVQEESYI